MKHLYLCLAVVLTLALAMPAFAQVGKGLSGPHYNLNIIGVANPKKADMKGSKGHTIFVNLTGNSKIYLQEGGFEVIDRNGTDGDGALFQLPNPGLECEGGTCTVEYSVYAVALGGPGGSAKMTTCAIDEYGEEVCSMENVILMRINDGSRKPKRQNVSKQLLTLLLDIDDNGIADVRRGLFDDDYEGYLWNYDNNGLRLAHLRFYPIQYEFAEFPECSDGMDNDADGLIDLLDPDCQNAGDESEAE